jgi:hypothetical protein
MTEIEPENDRLLDESQAAQKLAMTPRELVRLARIRDIASIERGENFYFTPRAIAEWIERNQRKAWA